ncbi:Conserved_hypothetical protein [Hexamita inflata]|uniref:Uncharacterized protein n=1 Tax=Hexamita inflata TaxID=28002 RepID=A0AA86P1K1_9EUKA|nr:Conserved hypothetical protein [Hexamita inflata]
MFSIFNVYVLTKNECQAGFEFKGNKCECAKKLSSDGLQCIPKCADVGEALNERGIPNSCYKCPDKITREDDSYCSLTVSCGANAKPDSNTGYSTCTCNDSSLVLNQDKKSCSCPPKTYFNAFERTCLSCPSGTSPDPLQTFCVCSSIQYFEVKSKTCQLCPKNSFTSSSSNVCNCMKFKQYIREEQCKDCGGGSTGSSADGLSCLCDDNKKISAYFDELQTKCIPCGYPFQTAMVIKDRSVCICPILGQVNINNESCQSCPATAVNKNPGVQNVDGCQCINSSYFWSAMNNTCTLCPFGVSNSENRCVCPPNSQIDNLNNSCLCYGNSFFDGHSCVECPKDSNVIDNVCRFNSSANPYHLQAECPRKSTPNAGNTTCVCDGNFFYTRSNNTCTECPFSSSIANNVCEINQYAGKELLPSCGVHAMPDKASGNVTCVCNDSSLVLLSDGINCGCPSQKYFNPVLRTCLQCPSGLSPDGTQSFCVCSSKYYFDLEYQSCYLCPKDSLTTPYSNVCNCKKDKAYVRMVKGDEKCESCGGGAKSSTFDSQSCSCDDNKKENTRFDELQNKCVPCGTAFLTAMTYKDRSVCICRVIGEVNINNQSCQSCPSNSVNKNPGVNNVDGCQCINSSFFWSAQNNTCTLCPFGVSNSDNQCVCPRYSQLNTKNDGCICYGNFIFDGHSCVECPVNSQVSGNICVCSIQSYQIQSQNGIGCFLCPSGSTPNQINQTCDCSGNSFYDAQSNSCIACPTNSQVSNNVCYCSGQSYQVSILNGLPTCFLCPQDSKANQINQTCDCDVNKIYDLQFNSCTSCPDNSISVLNTCVCSELSYQASDLSCVLCPSGSNVDQINQTCICSGNFFYQKSNNSCVSCPANSQVSNNICSCSGESYQVSVSNGVPSCFLCSSGSKANNSSKTCDCDGNSVYDSNTNICVECPDSFISQNNSCVCSEVSYLQVNQDGSESCVECPVNSQVSNNICSCVEGSYQVSVQNGLPTCQLCPENSVAVDNACECSEQSYQQPTQDGTLKCFLCPAGSKADAIAQTCDCYANLVYDPSSNSCTCVEQSYLQLSQDGSLSCVLCPAGSKPIGQTCQCDGNSIFFESACVKCLDNSLAIGNKCECSGQSYQASIQNGLPICILCPQDSKANQITNTCDCSGNSVYDSSSSSCVACPDNSISKNNICVCSSSSYQLNTDDNSLVCFSCPQDSTPNQLSQTCDCPANSIYSKQSNSCTKCPVNSQAVDNVCQCSATNSYEVSRLNGIPNCFLCPTGSKANNCNKTCDCLGNSIYRSSTNTCNECYSRRISYHRHINQQENDIV